MNTQWLTAESFELNQAVISAINRLSIHAKLSLAGSGDAASAESLTAARRTLEEFLDRFGPLVRDIERDEEAPIVGAAPRLGILAQRYVRARRGALITAPFQTVSLEELKSLLDSDRPDDQRVLVGCLRELRTLVEEHAHADDIGVLGEM
ncbi:MAG: hypothetical protein KGJ62_01490 [Armatimonadetes bacterium]|nr:hypothetical protein [Armatimonadota bacterium]MDE2205823.1 hypothetical protein [Armatimonadota bacterium]